MTRGRKKVNRKASARGKVVGATKRNSQNKENGCQDMCVVLVEDDSDNEVTPCDNFINEPIAKRQVLGTGRNSPILLEISDDEIPEYPRSASVFETSTKPLTMVNESMNVDVAEGTCGREQNDGCQNVVRNSKNFKGRRCFPSLVNDSEDTSVSNYSCHIYTNQIDLYKKKMDNLESGLAILSSISDDNSTDEESERPLKTKVLPDVESTTGVDEPVLNLRSSRQKRPCTMPDIPVAKTTPKLTRTTKKLYSNLDKLITYHHLNRNVLDSSVTEDEDVEITSSFPITLSRMFHIRVKWKTNIFSYHLESNEQFRKLLPEVSSSVGVPPDKIQFLLNDEFLSWLKTPADVNFRPGTIIECLTSSDKSPTTDMNTCSVESADTIELKLQSNTDRRKVSMKCNMLQPLRKLLEEYAALKGLNPEQLQLLFDGEKVDLDGTPQELDIEDGDCLDIVVEA